MKLIYSTSKIVSDTLNKGALFSLIVLLPVITFADYVDESNEVYQSLEYIAANGDQWIVTDIRPACTDTVKMKFRLTSTGTQTLYCSRSTRERNTFSAFYFEQVVRCDRNTNNSTNGNTFPNLNEESVVVADYATRRFWVNDIEQDNVMAEGDYTPGSVLMLFASHTQGESLSKAIAPADTDNRGMYRLYYFELYALGSETPKHCLLPARRKSDDVIGLYDIVERKFYGHADNSAAFIASPSITDVVAQQRYPWNGKVDISYTVTGNIAEEAKQKGVFPSLKVAAVDLDANTTNIATQLSGDVNLSEGAHGVVWDMNAEGLAFKSSNVVFNVSCETTPATYCVIDLSAGSNASSYPVTYLAEPPTGGFNMDAYKTTKLVLRRIEPGSFMMCGQYNVTLTKPFFCGIFEMTQKQYSLVTGLNPSEYKGDKRPVGSVSHNTIRGSVNGAKWPLSPNVDSTSFMGKLRVRTGLDFDLPTEAQWEYACRAGTTSDYNNGGNSENDLKQLGRYSGNKSDGKGGYSGYHTTVGSYKPNNWGLYDMHGNVWETCLDWKDELEDGVIDPKGALSCTMRINRGGAWSSGMSLCRASARGDHNPEGVNDKTGFRLVRTLSDQRFCIIGASSMTPIDLTLGMRETTHVERIRYSTVWSGGATSGVTANITVNDVLLASVTGTGYIDWTPTHNGTYVLTHKVMSGEEQIGETLTATFFVEPEDPVISPGSGTMFGGSLSVSMSCATEGATIHYTTNGVDPTADSPEYRRFRVYGKTTVKAVAEKDGMLSEVVTAEYALGQCADPIFSLADGAEFAHSNQVVSIWWDNDGVLRYTLDGTDPTAESPIYDGPFSFDDSVELRAKVFSDDFFDSAVVTSRLTRVWENVATPQIAAAASFTASKTKVVITCATEGATVRYTLDGNEPNSHSTKYTGPFYVTDSCTVKTYAVMMDYLNSDVATHVIEKVWGIGDTMGKPDHGFTTDGTGGIGWTRVVDTTAPNGEAMKSGAITHDQSSVLSTTVTGPGTLTFSWRASCEKDPDDLFMWDHAEFAVDGAVIRKVDGITSWQGESVRIEGAGEHTVTWTYKKDDVESEGDDAAYVAGYGWTSDYTETQTTDVPVPYAWLLQHDSGLADEYDVYEAAAKLTGANGRKVWECYMLGLDPESETNDFRIVSFPMKADGTPDLSALVFDPPKAKWNVQGATPVLKGASALRGPWNAVDKASEADKAKMRFFKVEVALP